ncbi:MAG: flagellar motor stator protein MotA [Betaproteobacteria bacterium]|nr:flagellar motor stator protein MotA [Betaproteobacteria bacterium]
MLVIVGYVVVVGSVLGGFLLHGGKMSALFQPFELMIIGGAAIGAFIVGSSQKVLKATFQALPTCLKGSKYTKTRYMELMALLYDVLTKIRKEGMMSVERDIEAPHESALFNKFPAISADHHLIEFITDYLRLMVSGNMNPLEIENLMDQEIETHHQEGHLPADAIQKVADGLPAFGIVAAVMGVVNVMGSVGEPPAILGAKIGAALVGTFVGILLAYGFVGPLPGLLGQKLEEGTKELQCIKVTLLACLQGYAPQVAVEFGRKILYSTERPTFIELETHVKQKRA